MNPSYLNGQLHDMYKPFRPNDFSHLSTGENQFKPWKWIDKGLRLLYIYIRYLWSNPDGPVFMVKLWMLILDRGFGRMYSFNRNPIRRSPNQSSLLSEKQNIGRFL